MVSRAVPRGYSLAFTLPWFRAIVLTLGVCGAGVAFPQVGELYQPALQNAVVDDGYRLTLLNTPLVDLPPISAFELVADREQEISGPQRGQATASAGRLIANFNLRVPELPAFVRREIPALWRLSIPAGQLRQRLPLRFEWENDLGSDSERVAGTRFEPLIRPWTHSERRDDAGRTVIEGGVYLDIPVRALQKSGNLNGRIVILVEE